MIFLPIYVLVHITNSKQIISSEKSFEKLESIFSS